MRIFCCYHRSTPFANLLNSRQISNWSFIKIPQLHSIVKSRVNFSTRSTKSSRWKSANRNTVTYTIALAVAVCGLSYAAVPLYRLFCQASGYGGTVVKVQASEKVEKMEPVRERELTIRFVRF